MQTITLIEKVKFKISQNLALFLPLINTFGLQLTILNAFPGIGDVLFLSNLVESIKIKYPNIKINVVTERCDLLKNNDSFYSINQKTTFFTFRHWYLEIRQNKNPKKHILTESLEKLGLSSQIQNPSYFVTVEERTQFKFYGLIMISHYLPSTLLPKSQQKIGYLSTGIN